MRRLACVAAVCLATAWTASLPLAAAAPPPDAGQAEGTAPTPVATPFAPPLPRASFVLEPPRVRIGDLAALELVVVTPPDHRVRPLEAPQAVPGFWLLGTQPLPVERTETRWIHRFRLEIRARELGVFLWPAQKVEIDGPDGTHTQLEVPAHTIEVASVLPEQVQRSTPYGLRAPSLLPSDQGALLPGAAIGALLTLFSAGLVVLVRRARRLARSAPPAPPASDVPACFEEALCALAAAAAEPDVQRAADCAALALRRFASHHFRAPTRAATTQELRTVPAPYLMHARWPIFLGLLEGLDEARFRPQATLREASVRSQVQAAEAFVRDSAPAEPR